MAPYVRNTETNNEMYKQNKTFAGKPMAQHTVYGRLKYLSIGRILGFSIYQLKIDNFTDHCTYKVVTSLQFIVGGTKEIVAENS